MCSTRFVPFLTPSRIKNGLKQFFEFSVLYGLSAHSFSCTVYLHKMPGRNRIPIEHRERIVRAFENEAEDYLLEADTLGANRSMARGIAARYIREGRTRERPRRSQKTC